MKFPVANSKSPSLGDKPNSLWEWKMSADVKEEPKSIERSAKDYCGDSEDDDEPIIMKRYTSSKKNHLHSELRKSSSHNHNGLSYRQISNAPSLNGQTSSMQHGNTAPSAKPLPVKHSVGISKALNSLVNTSSMMLPVENSKSPSLGDKPKPLLEQKMSIDVNEKPKSIDHCANDYFENSEDDEDIKLSSFRLKNSNHDNKATPLVVKKSSEESNDDDDIPLTKKLYHNSNLGTTCSNHVVSDQKKPISKIQKEWQNGSGKSNKQDRPSPLPAKRSLDNCNSLHRSVKNSKVSDLAVSVKTKPASGKHDLKVEDDDDDDADIRIFQRIKKSALSVDNRISKIQKERQNGSGSSNKPLSFGLKNPNHDNKATPVVKKSSEDSDDDDDVPLTKKLYRNSNLGTTSSFHDDSGQKKPISNIHKEWQNGSGTSNKQDRPSPLPAKRQLDNSNSLHPSVKKSKVSDPAASIKTKTVPVKHELKVDDDDDDDDIPISQRIKKSAMSGDELSSTKKVLTKNTKVSKSGSKSFKKQTNETVKKSGSGLEYSKSSKILPSSGDGQKKWTTLVHNGVIFPPPYQPHGVKMLYKGRPVDLTPEQEEVATMYAVMRDIEYILKDRFKENFWNDWQKLLGRNHVIQNLKDCDFTPIYDWYQSQKEKKKQMTTEVGNFRVEPQGLFRGRREDPKSQFYASIDDVDNVDEDIVIQEIALMLINFAANPKAEDFVEEPDDDDHQPFIPLPPTQPKPVDHEDLRVRVDILQEQLQTLQDELREERRLRIQAYDELYRLFHKR